MERKIGEIFYLKNQIIPLIVVRKPTSNMMGCKGCVFKRGNLCTSKRNIVGRCGTTTRQDGIGVIFKQAYKFMDKNELRITIPEGMVIDVANSDLSNGIIKFKRTCPTYESMIESFNGRSYMNDEDINAYTYLRNIAKLYNIVTYFNRGKTGEMKYHIFKSGNDYIIKDSPNCGLPGFIDIEDAQLVAENFGNILWHIFG